MPPRKRKAPERFELGNHQIHHFPQTDKEHYKRVYFEAIDFATTAVTSRFDQKDFKVYVNLQELLLKATAKEAYDAELAEVLKVYGEDLDAYQLALKASCYSSHKLLPQWGLTRQDSTLMT